MRAELWRLWLRGFSCFVETRSSIGSTLLFILELMGKNIAMTFHSPYFNPRPFELGR
jgi:hypothetical protein